MEGKEGKEGKEGLLIYLLYGEEDSRTRFVPAGAPPPPSLPPV